MQFLFNFLINNKRFVTNKIENLIRAFEVAVEARLMQNSNCDNFN